MSKSIQQSDLWLVIFSMVVVSISYWPLQAQEKAQPDTEWAVQPPSEELVSSLNLDGDFYKKHLDLDGFSILSSDKVSQYAHREAAWLIGNMLRNRPDLLSAIVSKNVRLAIMAPAEMTTHIPEHSTLKPAAYWDKRARGLGATDVRPAVSCGEENLLCYPGDPYSTENILVHEFAHVIHQQGLNTLDPDFDKKLRAIYKQAMDQGLWKGKYAGTNHSEYFAEAVQSWFGTNRENDHDHNHVDTREELKQYDPRIAELLDAIFGDNDWQYAKPTERKNGLEHLAGFDPTKSPRFQWPEKVRKAFAAHQAADKSLARLENRIKEDWGDKISPPSRNRMRITFKNETDTRLTVYWIDFKGNRKKYNFLDPGRKMTQQSFTGHLFELDDESGTTIARFAAGEKDGIAIVNRD